MKRNISQLTTYLLSIAAALGGTVLLIAIVMKPPNPDLMELTLLLGLTAAVSAVIGYVSYRTGWWRRLGSMTYALILGYVLAGALMLINVWVTAQLMFISQHDLVLATLLLIFAVGIVMAFGAFLSDSVTQTLRDVEEGAQRVREGDLSARVEVDGQDEAARLARSFNEMAARLEQAAREADALDEARRNLVAWASHDLRTPLASLRAMIDALADGVVADEGTSARYLKQSQNEIERMSALINDLFELAQMDAGNLSLRFEAASLGDLISDTLSAFTARAKAKKVKLDGGIEKGVDPVWMASDKVSRVLSNLVDNALRHSKDSGQISIQAKKQNESVLVSVKDSGTGIAAEDLPHVFDRFYRGEKSRARGDYATSGGSGLGLAIARRIVEAHGGTISAESVVGTGTTIRFTLPIKGTGKLNATTLDTHNDTPVAHSVLNGGSDKQ